MDTKIPIVATTLRMPISLMERIKHDADTRGQSLTIWITRACETRLGVPVPSTVASPPAEG